jgi:hypothetical protein
LFLNACNVHPEPTALELFPVSVEHLANEPTFPRDARFVTGSLVFEITASGELKRFRNESGKWRTWEESQYPGLTNGFPVGTSLVVSTEGLWLWNSESLFLYPIIADSHDSVRVQVARPEEVFVRGTRGGTPRDHGRLIPSPNGQIFERRSFQPEAKSVEVSAYLVQLSSDHTTEDTLISFPAVGYHRLFGGITLCCSPPLPFTPQAHWALLDGPLLAFTSGDPGPLVLIPLGKGLPIDSIPLDIHPKPAGERDFKEYVIKQVRATQDWPEDRVEEYSRRLGHLKQQLRREFSDRTPSVTQLFAAGEHEVWVRHFDPKSWPYGLSDYWTIVDISDRTTQVVKTFDIGLVHDLIRNGNRVSILSSVFRSRTETSFQITTLELDEHSPRRRRGRVPLN